MGDMFTNLPESPIDENAYEGLRPIGKLPKHIETAINSETAKQGYFRDITPEEWRLYGKECRHNESKRWATQYEILLYMLGNALISADRCQTFKNNPELLEKARYVLGAIKSQDRA